VLCVTLEKERGGKHIQLTMRMSFLRSNNLTKNHNFLKSYILRLTLAGKGVNKELRKGRKLTFS